MLDNIKSKYILKNIFDYLPLYEYRLKLAFGNRKLSNNLDINLEKYKEIFIKKKLKGYFKEDSQNIHEIYSEAYEKEITDELIKEINLNNILSDSDDSDN
jgi:hypothetical protein